MPKILINPKELILQEAVELLKEKGYKNFSIRELASRCNIATGTVYNYFTNKRNIISVIFNERWAKLLTEVRKIKSQDISFEEKIKLVYLELEEYLTFHKEIFLELYREENCNKSHSREQLLGDLYTIVDDIIEFHTENKEITMPLETRTLTVFIISNMILIIVGKDYFTFDDLLIVLKNKLN